MIRSLILLTFFLPVASMAASAPCGSPALSPLPSSVPAPEMIRSAPVVVTCVSLQAFTARLRQPVAPAPVVAAPDAYVPKTEHDNSPWRFDMSQNGRRMTADEFDAWMKAKGIRIATGKPTPTNPAAAAAAAPAAAGSVPAVPACVPSATVSC